MDNNRKGRILTGDRPTGKLHLGHYVGTLRNRVRLQDEYECFFIIADYHVLTTKQTGLQEVGQNIKDVAGQLSAGVDPSGAPSSRNRWCPRSPSCICSLC